MFINAGLAVAHRPSDPDRCIGRPFAFDPEITPPPPSDRLRPSQTAARSCIRQPMAFQPPQHVKDNSGPLEIPFRKKTVVCSGLQRKSQKMISKQFTTIILRLVPLFHKVDGACQWCLAILKVLEIFPQSDPKFTAEQ